MLAESRNPLICYAMGSSSAAESLRSPSDSRMSSYDGYVGCAPLGSGPFLGLACRRLGKTSVLIILSSKRNPPLLMISWTLK
jgi:hypothetical protein